MPHPDVQSFFEACSRTISHVAWDPVSRKAAIIDSVLDYDDAAGRTSHASADTIAAFVRAAHLQVDWIIETHVHADHLSAAPYLRGLLGGRIAIGERVCEVQSTFGRVFDMDAGFRPDGRQFDHLFAPGEIYNVGEIPARAIATPGHTPACMTHLIGDAAFIGDTLFSPEYGSARCDFPGGDAHALYDSVQALFALPDETRLFLCHDYPVPGREGVMTQTTVAAQKLGNVHVRAGIDEATFVAMRKARDATLSMPRLLLPSVQVNIRAGALPEPSGNGIQYLKIPLNAL